MNSAWPAVESEWDVAVAAFLRANPDWLSRHPEVYRALTPPVRVHGDAMADHMVAMLQQERQHAYAMTTQQRSLLAAGRAAASSISRVQEGVLALMAAENTVEFVLQDLPSLMQADATCLCVRLDFPGYRSTDVARLEELLAQRDLVFRSGPTDAVALYAEAAPLALHDVLILLPDLGVLGLASRAPFDQASPQTRADLRFLGRAVSAALLR